MGSLTQILFLLLTLSPYCIQSRDKKYSIEKNNAPPASKQNSIPSASSSPYRMNKMNMIWQKAATFVGENQLSELFEALRSHDDMEILYKHSKVNGDEDDDGEGKAKLLKNLNAIVNKFDLKEKLKKILKSELITPKQKPFQTEFNEVHRDGKKSEGAKISKADVPSFKDPKIEKLWLMASEHSEFSEFELEALRAELDHHQLKQDEVISALNEMDGSLMTNEIPKVPNSISKDGKLEKNLKIKKKELKLMKEKLGDDFDRLKTKIKTGTTEFEEPRVQDFWKRALNANFTKKEMESLKEELHHFQRKIAKHDWIMDRIKDHEEDHSQEGKSFDANHHNDMRQKQKDLEAKIKKMHSHLEEWIGTRDIGEL